MKHLMALSFLIFVGCNQDLDEVQGPSFVSGFWSKKCYTFQENIPGKPKGSSTTTLIEFKDDSRFILKVKEYLKPNCQGKMTVQHTTEGEYKIGNSVVGEQGAKEMDIKTKLSTAEIFDSFMLQEYNKNKRFGYSNWVLNQSKDVLGLDQGGKKLSNLAFLIIKIEKDNLIFSEYAETSGKRAKKFKKSTHDAYTKVK